MPYEQHYLTSFVKSYAEACQNPLSQQKFCFVLGAGASQAAGIMTGQQLVNQWDDELRERLLPDEYVSWRNEKGITDADRHEFYSEYHDKRYSASPMEGPAFFQNLMENKKPSCGHVILADLMRGNNANVVITTNFDHLIEDAIAYFGQHKPVVIGHEALAHLYNRSMRNPCVLKIHRDMMYDSASSVNDTGELNEKWRRVLDVVFRERHPVFLGYAGNDPSLMDFLLERTKLFETHEYCRPYWLLYKSDVLGGKARQFMKEACGILIRHEGFDDVMVQVGSVVGYKMPKQEAFMAEAEKRYVDVKTAIVRFELRRVKEHKGKKEDETDKAWRAIVEESGLHTPNNMIRGIDDRPYEEQREILDAVLAMFPEDAVLHEMYAGKAKKAQDFDVAEIHYKRALEAQPDYAVALGNYANFLADNLKQYDKAEEYYVKAMKAEPTRVNNMSNYALFLEEVRQAYDAAETYYKKALEIDPTSETLNAGYFSFLQRHMYREK